MFLCERFDSFNANKFTPPKYGMAVAGVDTNRKCLFDVSSVEWSTGRLRDVQSL